MEQIEPTTKEMAFSLIGAAKDIISTAVNKGAILASDEDIKKRWDICWECEFFKKQPEKAMMPYVCLKCGCGMKVKTRLAAMCCPIGKWGSTV